MEEGGAYSRRAAAVLAGRRGGGVHGRHRRPGIRLYLLPRVSHHHLPERARRHAAQRHLPQQEGEMEPRRDVLDEGGAADDV